MRKLFLEEALCFWDSGLGSPLTNAENNSYLPSLIPRKLVSTSMPTCTYLPYPLPAFLTYGTSKKVGKVGKVPARYSTCPAGYMGG